MIKKFYEYDFGGGGSINWRKEYDRLLKERNELKAENESLKAEINRLTMDNMTHEYNQAEAERLAPEFERQIREDEREKMKPLILKAHGTGWTRGKYSHDPALNESRSWMQFCKENGL